MITAYDTVPFKAKTVFALLAEANRAIVKHKSHTPLNELMSNSEKLPIIVEEVGEVARAMTYDEGDEKKLVEELIQLAAMSLMWADSLL